MHGKSSAFAKGELNLSNPDIVDFRKYQKLPEVSNGQFLVLTIIGELSCHYFVDRGQFCFREIKIIQSSDAIFNLADFTGTNQC